jgi:uncharacterized membrane protein
MFPPFGSLAEDVLLWLMELGPILMAVNLAITHFSGPNDSLGYWFVSAFSFIQFIVILFTLIRVSISLISKIKERKGKSSKVGIEDSLTTQKDLIED